MVSNVICFFRFTSDFSDNSIFETLSLFLLHFNIFFQPTFSIEFLIVAVDVSAASRMIEIWVVIIWQDTRIAWSGEIRQHGLTQQYCCAAMFLFVWMATDTGTSTWYWEHSDELVAFPNSYGYFSDGAGNNLLLSWHTTDHSYVPWGLSNFSKAWREGTMSRATLWQLTPAWSLCAHVWAL